MTTRIMRSVLVSMFGDPSVGYVRTKEVKCGDRIVNPVQAIGVVVRHNYRANRSPRAVAAIRIPAALSAAKMRRSCSVLSRMLNQIRTRYRPFV